MERSGLQESDVAARGSEQAAAAAAAVGDGDGDDGSEVAVGGVRLRLSSPTCAALQCYHRLRLAGGLPPTSVHDMSEPLPPAPRAELQQRPSERVAAVQQAAAAAKADVKAKKSAARIAAAQEREQGLTNYRARVAAAEEDRELAAAEARAKAELLHVEALSREEEESVEESVAREAAEARAAVEARAAAAAAACRGAWNTCHHRPI